VAIDRFHAPSHIYVADSNSNRVLGWSDVSLFINGAPAEERDTEEREEVVGERHRDELPA
jgi:hypothetical protein